MGGKDAPSVSFSLEALGFEPSARCWRKRSDKSCPARIAEKGGMDQLRRAGASEKIPTMNNLGGLSRIPEHKKNWSGKLYCV